MENKIQFHGDNYNELKDFLPIHYKIEVQSEKRKTFLFIFSSKMDEGFVLNIGDWIMRNGDIVFPVKNNKIF